MVAARLLPQLRENGLQGMLPAACSQQFFAEIYGKPDLLHLTKTMALDGPLDADVLYQSFAALADRQSALRSRFVNDGAGFTHVTVEPSVAPPVTVADIEYLPHEQRRAEALRRTRDAISTSFDLHAGPMWRALLIRLSSHHHVLVLVFHHSIFDAVSFGIFVRELYMLYAARVAGRPPSLPPLPFSYSDFAHWQREIVESAAGEPHLQFWRDTFAGAKPQSWLPSVRRLPPGAASEPSAISHQISASVIASFRALARSERTTINTAAMTAVAIALHRMSSNDDVLFAVLHNGRDESGLRNLVGCLAGAWILRSSISACLTFRDALRRVRTTMIGARRHFLVPFSHIRAELQRAGGVEPELPTLNYFLLDTPLDLVAKGHQKSTPGAALRMTDLPWAPPTGRMNAPLFLTLIETRESLSWIIQHSGATLATQDIEELSADFFDILTMAANTPDAPLSECVRRTVPALTDQA